MARIIRVNPEFVTVAFSDGSSRDFPVRCCLDFTPLPGLEVEVIADGENTVIRQVRLEAGARDPGSGDSVPEARPFVAHGLKAVKVSKIVYLLLAFFLGVLGMHRFFAGYVVSGVVYLLCSTLGSVLLLPPFIIVLLVIKDFIVALLKPSDEKGRIVV